MAEQHTAGIGFEKQIWDAACVLRGKLAGEFYTPACVVKTLVETLQPYNGRVYEIIIPKWIQEQGEDSLS